MRVYRIVFLLAIFAASASAGCTYKKNDIVQVPCTLPVNVSYVTDIVPIIQANCSECHSAGSLSSGILLDNYTGLKFYAENGFLYGTISHANGYRPMPDNGGKLSDCNIQLIKKWIDSGTPQ